MFNMNCPVHFVILLCLVPVIPIQGEENEISPTEEPSLGFNTDDPPVSVETCVSSNVTTIASSRVQKWVLSSEAASIIQDAARTNATRSTFVGNFTSEDQMDGTKWALQLSCRYSHSLKIFWVQVKFHVVFSPTRPILPQSIKFRMAGLNQTDETQVFPSLLLKNDDPTRVWEGTAIVVRWVEPDPELIAPEITFAAIEYMSHIEVSEVMGSEDECNDSRFEFPNGSELVSTLEPEDIEPLLNETQKMSHMKQLRYTWNLRDFGKTFQDDRRWGSCIRLDYEKFGMWVYAHHSGPGMINLMLAPIWKNPEDSQAIEIRHVRVALNDGPFTYGETHPGGDLDKLNGYFRGNVSAATFDEDDFHVLIELHLLSNQPIELAREAVNRVKLCKM